MIRSPARRGRGVTSRSQMSMLPPAPLLVARGSSCASLELAEDGWAEVAREEESSADGLLNPTRVGSVNPTPGGSPTRPWVAQYALAADTIS